MSHHPVFVENGESRTETAVVLVGTASEYGLDRRSIQATDDGFFITEELARLVYEDPEPETPTTKKTSGNRAAKKNSQKERA